MYKNTCVICHKEFECINGKTKCCGESCRKEWNRQREREWKRRQIEKRRRKKKQSLDSMTAEIARYNREHNTSLSYGKYVMLKERGMLNECKPSTK